MTDNGFGNAFQGKAHQPFKLTGGDPAALLVHGFPGSPAEMRPTAEALHAAGWTTRCMLLPGFAAEFEHIIEKRKEDWLNAVRAELTVLQREHDPVILIGNSMGGALSIELTATLSLPPQALILFAPFWKVDHIAWSALPLISLIFPQPRLFRYLNLDFDDPNTREGIHNFMPGADLDDPEVRMAIRDFRVPVKMFAEIRRAGHAAYRHADRVRVPSLVIQGEQDELVQPHMTRRMIARFRAPVQYYEVIAEHNTIDATLNGWDGIRERIVDFANRQRTPDAALCI